MLTGHLSEMPILMLWYILFQTDSWIYWAQEEAWLLSTFCQCQLWKHGVRCLSQGKQVGHSVTHLLFFFLFYLPDNNRKWITNNIGKVEERSGEET